jgi:ABC-2 type transport system ATP-binding protein
LIANLSKGYQQRIGIAQAIVHNPEVIILDEPTVGLDPLQIREIRSLIRELGQEHGVIFSTHILSEVEEVCTDVLIIRQGACVLQARIEDLPAEKSLETLFIELMQTPPVGDL